MCSLFPDASAGGMIHPHPRLRDYSLPGRGCARKRKLSQVVVTLVTSCRRIARANSADENLPRRQALQLQLCRGQPHAVLLFGDSHISSNGWVIRLSFSYETGGGVGVSCRIVCRPLRRRQPCRHAQRFNSRLLRHANLPIVSQRSSHDDRFVICTCPPAI